MDGTIDTLFENYDPEVQAIALAARNFVLFSIPEAIEQIDIPAKLIGYGYDRTYTGTICAIALQKSYVNLMFAHGAKMDDPASLLEGTGKRARHVKLRSVADVDRPAVKALLDQAVLLTQEDMTKKKK